MTKSGKGAVQGALQATVPAAVQTRWRGLAKVQCRVLAAVRLLRWRSLATVLCRVLLGTRGSKIGKHWFQHLGAASKLGKHWFQRAGTASS